SRARTAACLFMLAVAGVSIGLASSLDPVDEPSGPPGSKGIAILPRIAAAEGQKTPAEGKDRTDTLVFRGQGTDPDGKPVACAAIVVNRTDSLHPAERLATSGADGRFEAEVPLGS